MMTKLHFFAAVLAVGTVAGNANARSVQPTPTPVKVVVTDNIKPSEPAKQRPRVAPTPIVVGGDTSPQPPRDVERITVPARPTAPLPPPSEFRSMSFTQIKRGLAEAKRQMQSRPINISLVIGDPSTELVRIAFHDWQKNEMDYAVMTKESFLSTKFDKRVTSQGGKTLTVRTIRGNGVNTPIMLFDDRGEAMLPLMVQYPVIREGKYIETAYYMSTHPGLVTPEVVNAGKFYVRNVIDLARERLADRGIRIQPQIADVAERLAAVEHVDHFRFRNEPHSVIFNDIYTLFALNEGQTYRYSVSSAGAGGMVQMIPSTYRMVRSWHPNVPLNPDFVEGMRDHVNASEAMLIYIQRTWNDLMASPTVAEAFSTGIATREQLLAAGYNSNPARLAGYIRRGGAGWTNLIPRETKIYLQIYDSIERNVPMTPRSK